MARTVHVQAWWGEDWHTLPVWAGRSIRSRIGATSEARGLVPAEATLTLQGTDAEPYNPAHPSSVLYGLAARNLATRIAVRYAATTGPLADAEDTFDRTEATGWGTADVGGDWSWWGWGGTPAATDYAVTPGAATIAVPAVSTGRGMDLADLAAADVDVAVTITADTSVGGGQYIGITTRRTGLDGAYGLIVLDSSGGVTAYLQSAEPATLAEQLTSITHTGQAIRLRMRAAGRRLALRVWEASGAEPDTWTVTAIDDGPAPKIGPLGVVASRGSGCTTSTPVEFADFACTVEDPVLDGEASSWSPSREPGGPPRTDLTISGVMRRWANPDSPLESPLYRSISSGASTTCYYPLEDAAGATIAGPGTPGGRPADVTGPVTFGVDPGDLVGAASVAKLGAGAQIAGTITGAVPGDDWSQWWWVYLPSAPASGTNPIVRVSVDGPTARQWQIAAESTGWRITVVDKLGSTISTAASTWGSGAGPGQWLLMWLVVRQDGADVDWQVTWSTLPLIAAGGTSYYQADTIASTTIPRPTRVVLEANAQTADVQFAHAFSTGDDVPTMWVAAAYGEAQDGERAGDRVQRLAAECGMAGECVDDVLTPIMGPQTMTTLAALMDAIGTADGGLIYEPRGWHGVRLRPASTMYGQDPALTLDMTDQSVAAGLAPTVDDRVTVNDVVVTRPGGARIRRTVASGPMGTGDPPDGAGRVKATATVAVASDHVLHGWAGWALHIGTCSAPRYTTVRMSCERHPELEQTAAAVTPGDVIKIQSLDGDDRYLMVLGCTDEISGAGRIRYLGWVCAPADPYQVGRLDDTTGLATIGSDGSSLASDWVAGTDTTISVAVADGHPLWVTGSVDLQVIAGGAVADVSAISGSASPQTMTITAATVNGISKTVPAGTALTLRRPTYIGWEGT